jgi:hypothetical protein
MTDTRPDNSKSRSNTGYTGVAGNYVHKTHAVFNPLLFSSFFLLSFCNLSDNKRYAPLSVLPPYLQNSPTHCLMPPPHPGMYYHLVLRRNNEASQKSAQLMCMGLCERAGLNPVFISLGRWRIVIIAESRQVSN